MKFNGSTAFNLSESEIRYAMLNTKSVAGAARFLRVSYETFRKYARMYTDSETGKTLFELHKNQPGKGIGNSRRRKNPGNDKYGLKRILAGELYGYNHKKFRVRLLRSGILGDRCSCCGFEERRVHDYTVPLLVDWIDGDKKNHKQDNIRILCYNCYYLRVGNIIGAPL